MSNRVNVTFNKERYQDLSALASCKEVSMCEIVRECVENYLNELEDRYLSRLADDAVAENEGQEYIPGEEFWARVLQD